MSDEIYDWPMLVKDGRPEALSLRAKLMLHRSDQHPPAYALDENGERIPDEYGGWEEEPCPLCAFTLNESLVLIGMESPLSYWLPKVPATMPLSYSAPHFPRSKKGGRRKRGKWWQR